MQRETSCQLTLSFGSLISPDTSLIIKVHMWLYMHAQIHLNMDLNAHVHVRKEMHCHVHAHTHTLMYKSIHKPPPPPAPQTKTCLQKNYKKNLFPWPQVPRAQGSSGGNLQTAAAKNIPEEEGRSMLPCSL